MASAIGGVVTSIFKEPWYSQIIRPSFSPPSWVFGPVWTTLYILMSVAIWFNWISYRNKKTLNIYYKTYRLSFLLMLPYLIWSTYALILNGSIFYLN